MNGFKYVMPVLAAVAISACSTHVYDGNGNCLTCINNPITGEPVNHDEGTTEERMAKIESQQKGTVVNGDGYDPNHVANQPISRRFEIRQVLPVDVDVAYARIKRGFNMKSIEEYETTNGAMWTSFKKKDVSYRHEKTPGVLYELRDSTLPSNHAFMAFYYITIERNSADTATLILEGAVRGDGSEGQNFVVSTLKNAFSDREIQWSVVRK